MIYTNRCQDSLGVSVLNTKMQLHKGSLSIFEEAIHPQPIISRTKTELEDLFNSTVRLERLKLKSINDNPPTKDRYFLEPIPREMFLMFAESENPTVEYDDSPNVMKLLTSGSLSVDNDEEINEDEEFKVNVTPCSLDLESYKKRREERNNAARMIEAPPSATLASEDSVMTETSAVGTPAAAPAETAEEEFTLNTQDVNEMIESLIGPNSAQSNEPQPTNSATTEEAPAVSAPADLELPAVSALPAAIAITSINVDWIAEDEALQQVQDGSANKPVYTFPKKLIPVYPTIKQRLECDRTVVAARAKTNLFFNMHFEKSISALTLPSSDMDYTPEEQWRVSGKMMILNHLLRSLLGKDIILLIVVKDMGEEEMLIESIKETFKLDCVRMNYALENWEGEYGVFIKTKDQVDQQRGTAERSSRFEPVADFIISLDIRAKSNEALSKKISKRNSTNPPPIANLITLGSVEERAFKYLEEHNMLLSDAKSDEFKNLMREDNDWPEWDNGATTTVEELNVMVAENIKSWLLSIKRKEANYQYRSFTRLPRSTTTLAPPKEADALPVPTVVPAEETSSDMEIESEAEATPEVPLLSEKGEEFIKNSLFPLFDISKGELPLINSTSLLSSLPESDLKALERLPSKIASDYQSEVLDLKRKYEEAFQDLQNQYREKAFTSLRKP